MRQILICDDSCVCVNLLDYSKGRKMKKVIYHDLECRLNTYNRQKFLTLENDKDWEKSCKLGFSEPHYGLWGLSVLTFTDYKKDKDIVVRDMNTRPYAAL